MALFSAYEDFMGRTLGVLKGTWEKLVFIAGLRGQNNRYEHWGLEYTHGQRAARAAITQAHAEIFQKVLETPLVELSEELKGETAKRLAEAKITRLIPEKRNGCSTEHFRYVMSALTLLEKSRSSRQAA